MSYVPFLCNVRNFSKAAGAIAKVTFSESCKVNGDGNHRDFKVFDNLQFSEYVKDHEVIKAGKTAEELLALIKAEKEKKTGNIVQRNVNEIEIIDLCTSSDDDDSISSESTMSTVMYYSTSSDDDNLVQQR